MTTEALGPDELDALEARLDGWLRRHLAENPMCTAVDRGEPGQRRWYVRLRGEEKDITTIWFTLGQRTLAYETYVLPAPEEHHAEVYEHLLRRNAGWFGASFAIGEEDAIYLVGQFPSAALEEAEVDRIIGSLYAYVERCFRPLLRLAFASRFADPDPEPPAGA